jgi:hypothetical protein
MAFVPEYITIIIVINHGYAQSGLSTIVVTHKDIVPFLCELFTKQQ